MEERGNGLRGEIEAQQRKRGWWPPPAVPRALGLIHHTEILLPIAIATCHKHDQLQATACGWPSPPVLSPPLPQHFTPLFEPSTFPLLHYRPRLPHSIRPSVAASTVMPVVVLPSTTP